MSTQFLRQRVKFVRDELLDIVFPCRDVSGFRISILRPFVSSIEVVTQVLAGIDTRLDQLGPVLVQPSSLGE